MTQPNPELQAAKIDAIVELRSFARAIIRIASTREVPPPQTAIKIVDATPHAFYDAQYRGPLSSADVLYWRAVMNQEYNEAIDERYGPRPAPPAGIPLPEAPIMRKYQRLFGGEL